MCLRKGCLDTVDWQRSTFFRLLPFVPSTVGLKRNHVTVFTNDPSPRPNYGIESVCYNCDCLLSDSRGKLAFQAGYKIQTLSIDMTTGTKFPPCGDLFPAGRNKSEDDSALLVTMATLIAPLSAKDWMTAGCYDVTGWNWWFVSCGFTVRKPSRISSN